jgi:hypothetical protein
MKRISMLVLALSLILAACASDSDAVAEPSSTTTSITATTTSTPNPTTTVAPTTSVTSTTSTTSTVPAIETVPPPEGFVAMDGRHGVVSLFVRDTFIDVDMDAEDVEDMFSFLAEGDDQILNDELLELTLATLSTPGFDYVMFAFDFDNGSDVFTPTLNILRVPATPFDRIEIYKKVLPEQLASVGITVLDMEDFDTEAGPGLLVSSEVAAPDGSTERVIQLVVPVGDDVYNLTYAYEQVGDDIRDDVMTSFASFSADSSTKGSA